MPVIKVADMHCEKCVARITKLLTEEGFINHGDFAEIL